MRPWQSMAMGGRGKMGPSPDCRFGIGSIRLSNEVMAHRPGLMGFAVMSRLSAAHDTVGGTGPDLNRESLGKPHLTLWGGDGLRSCGAALTGNPDLRFFLPR